MQQYQDLIDQEKSKRNEAAEMEQIRAEYGENAVINQGPKAQ